MVVLIFSKNLKLQLFNFTTFMGPKFASKFFRQNRAGFISSEKIQNKQQNKKNSKTKTVLA